MTKIITNGVTSNGLKYNLVAFKDNFDAATKNNAESAFAIQMVANGGTPIFRSGKMVDC